MDFLNELAKQGFGFFLASGELVAIFYLFNKLIAEKEKRLTDAKEYKDAIVAPQQAMQKSLDTILSIVANAGHK